jgi:HK97 family phage portal protein
LFSEVNPFHTYRELVETTLTDLELTGNAFWVMMRGKASGVPVEIWPLPPAWMRVVPGHDEHVREYRLRRGGREVRLEARDVVHFRYPNPEDPWWGRSPLEAAIEAVQADESIARAQRRSFENGPFPGALLRTRDPLTKEQQERFRALFESRHVGPDAAGRLLMTDGEAEITPFTTSPREMDFVGSARSVRDRILGVFGVPPAVLGIVEDFNRANAQAAQEIFARATLLPKLALIASRVTQDVASAFLPGGITCEFASPVPADREANRRDMEAGVRLGVLSANEARADFYGKAPVSPKEGEDYDRPKPVAGARIDIPQREPGLE